MQWTLFEEINKNSLQAYVNARVYNALYWPTLFPLEYSPTMKYEILSGITGHRVMAEIVAPNSAAPKKSRPTVTKLTGDIPPIKLKRSLTEQDINKYNMLKALATTDAQNAILDMVFGDVDFCNDGLDGRLEWLALQAISQGSISLTATNSSGIITTDNIDFQIPSDNKDVLSAAGNYWTTTAKATNDPITDIEGVVSDASSKTKLAYMIMNRTKWQAFRASTAVQKFAASYQVAAASLQRGPSLATINTALADEGLPQIIVIDTRVYFENAAGTLTALDPLTNADGEDRNVTFLPDIPVGKTYYGPIAEETHPPAQVIQAKRGPYLLSKYSDVDPLEEHTKGEVNAFPALDNVDNIWILDTESHTTFGA